MREALKEIYLQRKHYEQAQDRMVRRLHHVVNVCVDVRLRRRAELFGPLLDQTFSSANICTRRVRSITVPTVLSVELDHAVLNRAHAKATLSSLEPLQEHCCRAAVSCR